jgi:uncharacterized protein
MSASYRPLAFTPRVLDAQVRYGGRGTLDRLSRMRPSAGGPSATQHEVAETGRNSGDALTDQEREFVTSMDGFYLATSSETGWPYVQFRGGPRGFVTSPNEHTIAWPDFRGNRQYITVGNVAHDDRVALIFMDYAHQARLKIYGHASIADLRSSPPGRISEAVATYRAKVEREIRVDVAAYDWNCPQHITPRYSAEDVRPALAALQQRIAELEAEITRLATAVPPGVTSEDWTED